MIKYFVRLDDKSQGPFSLQEIVDMGVRPSDYVWRKGMPDWITAAEDAEICRAMRRHLAGLNVDGSDRSLPAMTDKEIAQGPQQSDADQSWGARLGGFQEPQKQIDYDERPQGVSIFMGVLLALCCFPITGFMAAWFAYKFNKNWAKSDLADTSAEERRRLRVAAYENARMYRMMIGITFSLGLVALGLMFSNLIK